MTAQPFLLQMPDPDQAPARFLIGGFDTYVVYANTAADATALIANIGGRVWDNTDLVTPTPLAPAADMTGWRFRIQLFNAASPSVQVADLTVLAPRNTSYAAGYVALGGEPDDGDQFTIAGVVYTFKTALTPTNGEVLIGGTAVNSILHLVQAITYDNGAGTHAGTNYAGAAANSLVTAVVDGTTNTQADITALEPGTNGNSYGLAATTNVSTFLSVSGADLSGATGTTPLVSGLAAAMVTALNNAGVGISHAAYNTSTHVLTVAGTADNIGNYTFLASFFPPTLGFQAAQNADSPNSTDDVDPDNFQDTYYNDAGVSTVQGFPIPGFTSSVVDGGSAGSALTVTLVADTYTVPTVLVSARAQY